MAGGRTADWAATPSRWAREGVERGAGEILLTSMDRDGTKDGYDLDLVRAISEAVDVPVIASGGAGAPAASRGRRSQAGADAALVRVDLPLREVHDPGGPGRAGAAGVLMRP